MKFPSFGRKKSKARHTSPVQQLVLSTQNIGRAHSLTDLTDKQRDGSTEMIHARMGQRTYSEPAIIPYPSSGVFASKQKSAKPPKGSRKSGSRKSDQSIQDHELVIEELQREQEISNTRKLNELNDIVETLRNENAGLKEKVIVVESVQQRTEAILENERSQSRSGRSKKKKSKSQESIQTLDSHLDFPVDKAASELQKIISDLQIHNDKLQQNIFNKDKIIEKLKDDLEKRQGDSTELKRKNIYFESEVNDLKNIKNKLGLDLFAAQHANSQMENEKMEIILELERKVRDLENELQVAKFNFDKISREKAIGISQIDHSRIIRSIQNKFEENLKQKEIQILDEQIKTAKVEEMNKKLDEDITQFMVDREQLIAKMETIRQNQAEKNHGVAPLIIENEVLQNKNELLQQRMSVLQRELCDFRHQYDLEKHVFQNRPHTGSNPKALEMRQMMVTLQDDWRDVVTLIQQVEIEKSQNVNQSFGEELKKLNNIAMEMEHRESSVQAREQETNRQLCVSSLREKSSRY